MGDTNKNVEFVRKFNEIMNKYGSVAEFSKVLYEANLIPGNPIVIADCMIPVNDLARCLNVDLKTTINKYLERNFSESKMIQKLGVTKLTKDEIIGYLTQNDKSSDSNNSTTTLDKGSREILKFQQTSKGNNNPKFSDGTREIMVSNNGVNVVSYSCAVFMTKFMTSDIANTVQLNLMDMTASAVKVTKAYTNAMEKVLDTMEDLAKEGKAVDSNNLMDIVKEYADTSKYLYRNELAKMADRLYKIYLIYKNGNFDDPIGIISSTMSLIKMTENEIRRTMNIMDFTLREISTSNNEYGKEDCVPKLPNETTIEHRKRIGVLNAILENQGYLKIKKFRRDTWDEDGNRLKGQGKEITKTVVNPKNEWLFDSSIVITGTDKSTTFKLTEYGKAIFTELYKQAEEIRLGNKTDSIVMTKEEFDAKFLHTALNTN